MFLERDVIASYLSVLIRLKLNATDYYRRSSESQRLKQLSFYSYVYYRVPTKRSFNISYFCFPCYLFNHI